MSTRLLRSGILLFVLILPLEAFAAVGRLYFASGTVYVERGSQKIAATRDMLLEQGDVIVTEQDGRAQWRMADDAYFVIRPDTRVKIDEFQMPSGGNSGRSYFSLLKGGFRSITGLIGKGDHAAYQVRSSVATMGVRGTDHTHVLCQGDCAWAGSGIADGLYTRVDRGASFVSNTEGSLEVKGGQYAQTRSPPVLVTTMPPVFADWAVDFRIDFNLAIRFEHEDSPRIEPIEDCIPVPSPNTPCP